MLLAWNFKEWESDIFGGVFFFSLSYKSLLFYDSLPSPAKLCPSLLEYVEIWTV